MLDNINTDIMICEKCPRLVIYRQRVAAQKRRAFLDEIYWGKPVSGWGESKARLLIVGLAPAAHGANRTGRMFTGDNSGNFLFEALYQAGFASQSLSKNKEDGLQLFDTYISNIIRCVPPENKPIPDEIINCRKYLQEEINVLENLLVILALGKIAYENTIKTIQDSKSISYPNFFHGVEYNIKSYTVIASYHPSHRNTATGLLTSNMMNEILSRVQLKITQSPSSNKILT